MTDKDTAREKIAQLVEKYRQIKPNELKDYQEEETKKDFLVPMFQALGWNMEDRNEVRAEEKIVSGFADYSFRLNGVTHFYLEAKRFSADLNDKKYMQQAINYAYLKGVTWTVLSDFEQLMVFNANWEERDPLQARFINLTWEQYAESGFEQLWLLAKPSLEAHEMDTEAEKWGKKKTRARVTDVLFADLTKWRQELFKDIRGYSETLWSQDAVKVDEAIQRFLDRLIFVRTVEDRQIEDNRLRALLRQYDKKRGSKKNLFQDMLALFRELDSVYNARLFAESTLDRLTVNDENLLRDIVDGLYDVKGGFANYDFSAIDADVLGSVYEQYLGFKAQDPKGEDSVDLKKRSKRKAQGIYYTPHFVVRYIVQQTLGKLLNAPDMTPEKAHQLRILDPACGSGSFLIEAFDVLDNWLAEHGDTRDREFPRQRKMRILQENIYGVDLDPQAVEVARLNLLLRAARERQLLPMLNNIQHGNSLIDDPAIAGEAAFNWEERFPDVMNAGGFDIVIGNPPYVRQEALQASKQYFQEFYQAAQGTADLYVYFIEKGLILLKPGGLYSVIVSNSFLRTSYGAGLRQYLRENYALLCLVDFGGLAVFESAKDTYVCIPLLSKQSQPQEVQVCQVNSLDSLDLTSYVPQHQYSVSISQFTADRWSLDNKSQTSIFEKMTACGVSLGKYIEKQIFYGIKTGLNEAFVIDSSIRANIIKQSPQCETLLKQFLGGQDIRRYSIREADNYLVVIPSGWTSKQITEERKLKSKHSEQEAWDWLKEHYAPIAQYLQQFEPQARKRQDKGEFWWELRPCDYYDVLDGAKIIYPDIAKGPRFYLDTTGTYIANTAYCLGTDSLYLLGVLNSRLSWFAVARISIPFGVRAGEYRYRMIYQYMEQLPIRTINFDDPADKARHDRMVEMVENMLALKKDHAAAEAALEDRRHDLAQQIDRLDAAIDALVYELYGLTDDEIAIVEGRAND